MWRIEADREKRVAQILATDTTREQLADALWCAEDCVRHLVERTSLLNDRISKLRTEFDRMDKWHSAELMAETDENRKLRELVRDLLQPILADGFDCYGCVHEDCDGMQYTDRCRLLDQARELGVEVEE